MIMNAYAISIHIQNSYVWWDKMIEATNRHGISCFLAKVWNIGWKVSLWLWVIVRSQVMDAGPVAVGHVSNTQLVNITQISLGLL